ncbi:bis(5'-nucleosyl)-tetraphosphatase (symmetrical) YqeK [Paenactinomyces guangxiensis]|uniref:bis(5'-nucleosyl)-tetraphosphatase (symmetrical) n=1 Tax=Paenactinomyces guangxiensis TaxID=1490290 RepID=A0A7W1WNB6_9BACL|nr:bis(5'-nucleosyl)-tetraphosphatase (symmetrical) YqeK [Paenactinomyces guangxiensis]MBA4493077.1 bis(5'-nucleosyl)-tetraphosphatase (symmetrical) YqeK [Paenactinomyces guangxiensis]MBH8590073.1 bis(5'-nucleosyl)-tetraphosphatase (symmetrical) YqeK [Paenactinomyces guangxiensis]
MEREFLLQATKKQLTPARWEHTLRVSETAAELARREGVDPDRAEVAGILHDYCKFWETDELVSWIKKCHLPEDLLSYHKELWHAPVGAEVIREELHITDEDILNAVRYHTSGRPGMSKLEKIIFLADYIEPGRRFPGVDEVRELAKTDLDQAVLQAMNNSIVFLIQRGQKVYPLTLLARNDMLDQIAEKHLREESF